MLTPASSDVTNQVKRIRESDTFRSAPQVSRLLTFLTDGTLEGESLKESVIGVSFFNRPSDYDPQTDPVVRTEVRRLRLKLSEYYLKEGVGDRLLIEIPAGGYKARFSMREVSQPELNGEALSVPDPVVLTPSVVLGAGENRAVPGHAGQARKALVAAAVLLIGAAVWLLPRLTGHVATTRRSVVVFGLRNLDGGRDTAWLGKTLSEMLSASLSSNSLRSVSIDDEARTRLNLGVFGASLGPAELSRIRKTLGADLVVAGSYLSIVRPGGPLGSRGYRMDVQIYDARTGRPAGSASDTSDERTLFDMVSRVGASIGQQLGIEVGDAGGKHPAPLADAKVLNGVELAKALTLKGDFLPNGPDRERLYLQALEVGRKESLGPWELEPLIGLAQIYAGRRDFEKAANFFRQGYDVSLKYNGPDNAGTAEAEVHWARARTRLGERKEAIEQLKEAIPVARRGFPSDSLRLWNILHDAIHTCLDVRAFQDAESYTREGLGINERMHLPVTSERWGMLYWDLGRAKRGQKNYREAILAFEKAEANFVQFPDTRIDEVRADLEQVKAEQRGEVARRGE